MRPFCQHMEPDPLCEVCGEIVDDTVVLETCNDCLDRLEREPVVERASARRALLMLAALTLSAWAVWLLPAAVVYVLMR